MRILHLTSSHPPDDVRIFLKECRSLAQAGFEVHLVAPESIDQTREGVVIHGFDLPGGPRPVRIVRRLWRVWQAGRTVRPDLVHFHEPELAPVGLLLRLAGARIVYDVHEDYPNIDYPPYTGGGQKFAFRVLEGLARRLSHAFAAATPAIAQRFPPEKTVELYNYVLPEEISDEPTATARKADVVYVGGISGVRGAIEMVSAAGCWQAEKTRLVLIGRFETARLEQEARSLPGWSRVVYLGMLDRREARAQLAEARVGLVVFHPERDHLQALPNKLFEYMSAGLALVASDFPFWREMLDPVGCAIFVDPLDPAEIALAVDELLSDGERAAEMGRLGAVAVRERFNWGHEAPKLIELYARLGLSAAV